jgi:hypothetical protein
MSQEHKIGCMACKYNNFDGGCAAFPDQIPMYFADGQEVHTKPTADQGNDIVFEWIDRVEQRVRMKQIVASRNENRQASKVLSKLAK